MIDKNGIEKKYKRIDWTKFPKGKTDIGANPTCIIDLDIKEQDDRRVVPC